MRRLWRGTGVIGLGAVLTLSAVAGLRINTTESMPRGLWREVAVDGVLHHGDVVAACLPDVGQIRHYVGEGSCPNGLEPVLKTIGAIAGDDVETTADGVRVNGVLMANTAPMKQDSQGRTLERAPFVHYRVGDGEVWLLSSYSARSFDSRYFGSVAMDCVIARGVPVLVWK